MLTNDRRGTGLAIALLAALSICGAHAYAADRFCDGPSDLTRLERPLVHVGEKLAAREPIKIVALGSSSTAGAGASSPAASYPSRLEFELNQPFFWKDVTGLNRGVD